MISETLPSLIGWIGGLSLWQLGLAAVSILVGGYLGAMALMGWIRTLLMQYALKKVVAFGLLSSVGAELIPGFSLLSLLSGVIPI